MPLNSIDVIKLRHPTRYAIECNCCHLTDTDGNLTTFKTVAEAQRFIDAGRYANENDHRWFDFFTDIDPIENGGSNGWLLGSDENDETGVLIYFDFVFSAVVQRAKVASVIDTHSGCDTFTSIVDVPSKAIAAAYSDYSMAADHCLNMGVPPFEEGENIQAFGDRAKLELSDLIARYG